MHRGIIKYAMQREPQKLVCYRCANHYTLKARQAAAFTKDGKPVCVNCLSPQSRETLNKFQASQTDVAAMKLAKMP